MIATAVVAFALLAVGMTPAQAVGPAALSIELTAIDPITGQDVTATAFGQNNDRLAYRVGYSCSVADCTDAVVTLPAFALDPTYNRFRMYEYETWTPPAGGGATITSSLTAGVTVRLGNVPAGTSATFVVQYQRFTDTSAPDAVPASYFPPGYQIQQSATIASPNATASSSANAAPVTWNIQIPEPSVQKTAPATTAPDTDITYTLAMSSGCFEDRGSARWTSTGRYLCAENYSVVDRLPAQAVFVSASGGGQYNPATHTVNWTASGASAAGGWGASTFNNWSQRFGYGYRTVTVRYPASAFPESAGGANFSVPVTNNVDVSVTYLDDAATTKTTTTSFTNSVAYTAPFGRADQTKISTADQQVGAQRYVNVPPDTTGLVCPSSGKDDWNRACTAGQPVAPFTTRTEHLWQVDTYNRGNVAGIATVVDNTLGNSSVRVRRIVTEGGATAPTIAWTITDGTTSSNGTTTGTSYTAPAGSWLTAATVTSGSLAGPNLLPSGTAGTRFRVAFGYDVPVGSPLFTWTNSASATMTYPGQPQIAPIPVTSSAAVTFRDTPKVTAPVLPPTFGAAFSGAPVVEGGGQVVPGGKVTFRVFGATSNIPVDRDVSPQYIFIAPTGWNITPNSASFPAGSVPPGVSFVYKNVTIAGVTRQAVIASWPTGATFGSNASWPIMSVTASPTAAVPAGTNSIATIWAGDSRNAYDPNTTTWTGKVVDATDVDGDGNLTEAFASAGSAAVFVSGTSRLDVIKEICVETANGCNWVSNPDIVVGVNPNATNITYRVTLVNGGNTILSNVVGYDVLPFVGDTRGSTFGETVNAITSQTGNVSLSYSGSSNPCRAEVVPVNPGCAVGWIAAAPAAKSIRAVVAGSLAPAASASFVFTANVLPGAPADAVACNSVAVDSGSTLPSEPRPVCATTQLADLQIQVPERLPLQAGRPGVVPFTVTNLGPSVSAPASVDVSVPAGIRITNLAPAGWQCTASTTAPDGSVLGPVTLTCLPVTAEGASRVLRINEPSRLDLPAVIPDASLVGQNACFPGVVSGLMSDPNLDNNSAQACFDVTQGESLISLTKDDGRDSLEIGDEFTYTIDVANLLVGESPTDVVISDELPPTLAFVSASNGGSVENQGDAGTDGLRPGGTVTWNLASLAPSGELGDGDSANGATGSTEQVTVTVRVVQAAEATDTIANTATATATDPAQPEATLNATDSDTDALNRIATLSLVKSATPTSVDSVDDTVAYSFLVTNTGTVTLTTVSIAETAFTGSGTAPSVTCPAEAASVAPGDSVTCTASYAAVQADLDAGFISNTATASGTAPTGITSPVSTASTAIVSVTATPAIELEKTVSPTTAAVAGDTVTYSFEVTNTGNVTLYDPEIDEVDFSGSGAAVVPECAVGALAPSASVTCEATYTVTQTDVDAGTITNTATAAAFTAGAVEVSSNESSATVTIEAEPAIALEKTVAPATASAAGDTVTYSFEVTNTGNVTVYDPEIGESAFTGAGDDVEPVCAPGAIAPGAAVICVGTYELVQDDIDAGTVTNTATATAFTADDVEVTSEESTATVTIEARPAITLQKTVSPTSADAAGDSVTYSFKVTNTGNVTVFDVDIDETDFTGAGDPVVPDCAAGAVAPGGSVTCTATYELVQTDVNTGSVTNTATAAASTADQIEVLSAASTATLTIAATPSLTLEKTVAPVAVDSEGDTVTYSFEATNTGNVTLFDVVIDEVAFSGLGDAVVPVCAEGAVEPGDSVTCTGTYDVVQADIDAGTVTNTATATAFTGSDVAVPSAPSTATLSITAAPALELTKSVSSAVIDSAGDTVTYLFDVENTGNVTLTNVQIEETAFTGAGGEVVPVCADGPLAPGASITCSATYDVVQADVNAGQVENTAIATATTGLGAAVSSESSTATVLISANPSLTVVKSASPTDLIVGQEVTYSFVVTNTGNVTIEDIAIDEVEFTGSTELSAVECGVGAQSLDPDTQLICEATYTITQADLDAGTLSNTATVTGTAPGGSITSEESTVQLPFVQEPGISVIKSADVAGFEAAGDDIEYQFEVTNTGNVTLSAVEIAEGEFSGSGDLSDVVCDITTLLPGQRADCTAGYEVTQTDVDSGVLTNSATATALAPLGDAPIVSEPSQVTVPFVGVLALGLQKAGKPVDVDGDKRITVKDRIKWTFTVTNLSAATLSDLAVSDPMAGAVDCAATVLLPGATVDCAATEEYQITAAQAAAGEVRNVATASAVGVGSAVVTSSEATAVVEVVDVLIVPATSAPTGTGAEGDLAATGLDTRIALALVLLVLLAGAATLVINRRRRNTDDAS